MEDGVKKLYDKHNCLVQEPENAEKERAIMSNWRLDLKDQRADTERELCQVELDIRRKKGEWAQVKAREGVLCQVELEIRRKKRELAQLEARKRE